MANGWIQYALPAVILIVVLTFRLRSMRKTQALDPKRLWIVPALLVVVALFTIFSHPPGALGFALSAAALAVGGAIGWQRGRMMRIDHDPATGKLTQTASPAAMLLLIAIIAVRFAARAYFGGGAAPTGGQMDQHTLIATDALLAFAVGLLGMTRIEMMLRARRILAAARNVPA